MLWCVLLTLGWASHDPVVGPIWQPCKTLVIACSGIGVAIDQLLTRGDELNRIATVVEHAHTPLNHVQLAWRNTTP